MPNEQLLRELREARRRFANRRRALRRPGRSTMIRSASDAFKMSHLGSSSANDSVAVAHWADTLGEATCRPAQVPMERFWQGCPFSRACTQRVLCALVERRERAVRDAKYACERMRAGAHPIEFLGV